MRGDVNRRAQKEEEENKDKKKEEVDLAEVSTSDIIKINTALSASTSHYYATRRPLSYHLSSCQ